MRVVFVLLISIFILSCTLPQHLRKTQWTVTEVKEWSAKAKNTTWKGIILYQGSDSLTHHFISRVVDEWVWFGIKRAELSLEDVRPVNHSSSEAFGYYYVDPTQSFIKVKDFAP